MIILRLERAIKEAWGKTEKEFLDKKCPRSLFWTESAALVHPFYCNLKKIMEEKNLIGRYQIVTEYNPKTPGNAECSEKDIKERGDTECGCKNPKKIKLKHAKRIDLCILEFEKEIDLKEGDNRSIWCFNPKIVAAMEFKSLWNLKEDNKNLIKKDIKKLLEIGKKYNTELLYMCFTAEVNKKDLLGYVKKFKRIKFAVGYYDKKWYFETL